MTSNLDQITDRVRMALETLRTTLIATHGIYDVLDDDPTPLAIGTVLKRLEGEALLFRLEGLNYWAVSPDGKAPDPHIVATMLAHRHGTVLGLGQEPVGGLQYPWGVRNLTTAVAGTRLEFIQDEAVRFV